MVFIFGAFELDDERYELRRNGEIIELRRKVFDVLRYLVTHGSRLVTKDELLQSVWPSETIHEGVVAQNIAIVRRALGDRREAAKMIQTVHGRGYRFIAEVSSERANANSITTLRPRGPVAAPFIGREHVMLELRRLLRDALSGKGQVAMLSGEAGIGKTRTTEELAREAVGSDARVLEGRCHEADGAPAFWPWVQILRAAGALEGNAQGERAHEIERLLGELHGQPGELPKLAHNSAQARFRLFDAVTALLAQLAREQPLLLIFDDLHWADEGTLHLLRFAAREVRGLPIFVLGTTRDVDARNASGEGTLLSSLLGGADVHRIYLDGLSPAATSELASITLQRDLGEMTLRELHSVTEGNPFFLHEVLRLLIDDESAGRGERWRLELPRRLREVIALRLQSLPPDAQRLLALASVLGRDFSVAVLEQIANLPRAEILTHLEAAVHARIVREAQSTGMNEHSALESSGRYSFAHALIRESLYAALPERVRIHAQVARALEALFGVDAEAHLDELAYHFYRAAAAGDVAQAVSYCERAAARAMSLLAFEQAVLHYRRALDALSCQLPIDEYKRFELKLALGAALFRAGEDGNPALLAAAEIARRLGPPELLARVVLAMCGWPRLRARGRTANHVLYPLLSEAIAAMPPQSSPARVRLLSALALNCPEDTPLAEQISRSREALELARGLSDDEALYDALLSRLRLMQAPEDTARRLGLAGELVASAQRMGHKELIFTAHELRIQPLLALGDLSAADQEIEACSQLAETLRLPRCTLIVKRLRLERALGDGRFDEIRPLTEEAVRLRGPSDDSPGYLTSMFVWHTFERTYRGKRAWFDRTIAGMAAAGQRSEHMRAYVACAYAEFGHLDQARACYEPLLHPRVLDAAPDDNWLLGRALTAGAVALCEDRAAARELYPRMVQYAALNVTHFEWLVYLGCCSHWLGLLAALLGEHKMAASHFETALEMNASLGARPALARTQVAYARVLLRSGANTARSNSAHGRAMLREAIATAEALDMRPLLKEAQHLSD